MGCQGIQEMLAMYVEGELEQDQITLVKSHLSICQACQKRFQSLQKSWELLEKWQNVEPSPGYISAFWTRLASVKPSRQMAWKFNPVLVPVFATFCILILVGSVIIKNHIFSVGTPEVIVLNLSDDEVKMLENFELAESYDLIKDIDFWENLEGVEDLERTGG